MKCSAHVQCSAVHTGILIILAFVCYGMYMHVFSFCMMFGKLVDRTGKEAGDRQYNHDHVHFFLYHASVLF